MRYLTAIAVAAITLALPASAAAALTPHQKLERAVGVVVHCVPLEQSGTYTVVPYSIKLWEGYCDGIFRSLMKDPPYGPVKPLDAGVIYGWQSVATLYQNITCRKFGIGCSHEAGDAEYQVNSPNVVPRLLDDVGIAGKYKRDIRRAVERAVWGTP